MRIFLNKILMVCCLTLLLQTYVIGQNSYSCDDARFLVSKFVSSKKINDWGRIRVDVYKLQNCKCEVAPVFYYIYRMNMLLPNSHALQGISPNDFITSQKLNIIDQIKILNNCDMTLYLPLINTMIKQNFDSEMAESARELKLLLTVPPTF